MLLSRRGLLALAGGASLLRAQAETGRLRILVAGGHPGDPECGCGGTIARYTSLGHEVTVLYLNRGEGYCGSAPPDQCGTVRTAEARKACEILKAHPVFATQVDGKAIIDNSHYEEFGRLFDAHRADIVFTQWPIDHHRDHRAISLLVLDAWMRGGAKPALYFYEVADDTQMFSPAEFVDISGVETQRRTACYAHASQQPDKWYPRQVELTRFRGGESGFPQAEGFLRHRESKRGFLP